MKTQLILAAAVAALAVATLGARSNDTRDATVSGTWNLTVKGPAAHGDMAATMQLTQDGSKVTGTFAAHGNEHKLTGRFADRRLTLEATDAPPDHPVTLTATLKDDDTLAGYLSGPMGDMQWTAARASNH